MEGNLNESNSYKITERDCKSWAFESSWDLILSFFNQFYHDVITTFGICRAPLGLALVSEGARARRRTHSQHALRAAPRWSTAQAWLIRTRLGFFVHASENVLFLWINCATPVNVILPQVWSFFTVSCCHCCITTVRHL